MLSFKQILLLLISFESVLGGKFESFQPHKISFSELKQPLNDDSLEHFKSALTQVGLVSVTGVPGFKELRTKVLSAASTCVMNSRPNGDSISFEFQDGTKRHTLGAKTEKGKDSSIEGADISSHYCRDFAKNEKKFRALVEESIKSFSQRLDQIQGLTSHGNVRLLEDVHGQEVIPSFERLLDVSTQLEHFHTYEGLHRSHESENDFNVDMHLDHGLFIALVPALELSGGNGDHGFYIQLENGDIVRPDFNDNNEIVFMIGDGFRQWLNPKLNVPFRATPHAVKMSNPSKGTFTLRSWYGRMVLPAKHMVIDEEGRTFGEALDEYQRFERTDDDIVYTSCSPGLALSERLLSAACSNGEIACWLTCVPISCEAGSSPKCGSIVDDELLECVEGDGQHGPQCQALCIAEDDGCGSAPTTNGSNGGTPTSSPDFCNGFAVSMFMEGFTFFGSDQNCLAFLIPELVLDDPLKFTAAGIATILVGAFTEFLTSARRNVTQKMSAGVKKDVSRVSLYALQTAFGYIAMLIAMTYSVVLFVLIIVGLSIGHRLYNFNIAPKEFSDPCCAQPEGDVKTSV